MCKGEMLNDFIEWNIVIIARVIKAKEALYGTNKGKWNKEQEIHDNLVKDGADIGQSNFHNENYSLQ